MRTGNLSLLVLGFPFTLHASVNLVFVERAESIFEETLNCRPIEKRSKVNETPTYRPDEGNSSLPVSGYINFMQFPSDLITIDVLLKNRPVEEFLIRHASEDSHVQEPLVNASTTQ